MSDKKAMLVATTASMIEQFNQNNIKILQSLGYEVHIACNFEAGNTVSNEEVKLFRQNMVKKGVKIFDMPIARPPFAYGRNLISCFKLRKLIKQNKYAIIHCHTPMGSVVARIAAYSVRNWHGRVIYTAHGFHFFKGAPKKNHLVYGTVEQFLARFTDCIITINNEDYKAALQFNMKDNGEVYKIPGVGIDVTGIQTTDADEHLRESIGVGKYPFILSVGELNVNKNHEVILNAMYKMHNKKVYYVICGQGNKFNELKEKAKILGLKNRLILLGYRDDVIEIMHLATIFVHPSFREGLSVALMQAMATGLPVVASKIRGNVDLIKDGENGFLLPPNDSDGFAIALDKLLDNKELREKFSHENIVKSKKYDEHRVNKYMKEIYGDF